MRSGARIGLQGSFKREERGWSLYPTNDQSLDTCCPWKEAGSFLPWRQFSSGDATPKEGWLHEVFLLVAEGINCSLLRWGFGWHISVLHGRGQLPGTQIGQRGRKKGLAVLEREMSNNHRLLFKTQLVSQPLVEAVPGPPAAYTSQPL